MSTEEFLAKFSDLIYNFANTNPNTGTIVKGETIEIDESYAIDVELRTINKKRTNNENKNSNQNIMGHSAI